MSSKPSSILNSISVDVEEHFQVSAFEGAVPRDQWNRLESRVEANTERLLELFAEFDVQGTFFILGWIAERFPRLVREIADQGHEIACHGYAHRLVYEQTPVEFGEELRRSKALIEQASGVAVNGYRAASFSITNDSLWALDELVAAGFRYDSSLFPVYHDRYGVPGMPREIYRVVTASGKSLIEAPPSTVSLGRMKIPVAGGGYLRIFPRQISHWAIRRLNHRDGMPAVVYLHPWEVDPEQPRIKSNWKSELRHYTGLKSMMPKLRELLTRYEFGTMEAMIERHGQDLRTIELPKSAAAPDAVAAS